MDDVAAIGILGERALTLRKASGVPHEPLCLMRRSSHHEHLGVRDAGHLQRGPYLR
jgi:hypothetical protein